jgi:antitoxin PrlF
MTPKSTLSAKGQVTIPAKVRKSLGLKPGDKVAYKVVGNKAELIAIKGTILDAAGSVKPKKRPEDLAAREIVKKRVAKRAAERNP